MNQLQTLIDAYPRLFKGSPPGCSSYVMAGWQPVVARLCARIDLLLTDEEAERFTVQQIKEKFGGLRFYYRLGDQEDIVVDIQSPGRVQSLRVSVGEGSPSDDDARELIREYVEDAIRDADTTCEYCGQSGSIRDNGWLAILCDTHAAMRDARQGPWARTWGGGGAP